MCSYGIYIVMAYIVMVYILMAYIVPAHIVPLGGRGRRQAGGGSWVVVAERRWRELGPI